MRHFSSEGWFDFARGVISPELKAVMQHHLDDACEQCATLTETWRTVIELTRREVAYSPPSDAVRLVKAAYTCEGPSRWLPEIARVARLIFDSSSQPAPAAVRSSQTSSRQFLHEAEPFVIDLRIESDPARRRIWLLGQVLDSDRPEAEMKGVDIVLLSAGRFVAKTVAKSSGEFELELGDEKSLQLFINIRGNRAIGIVLPDSET